MKKAETVLCSDSSSRQGCLNCAILLVGEKYQQGRNIEHTSTAALMLAREGEITANINENNWFVRKWNEIKDIVVSQPKTTTGNITLVQGNISGAGVKAAAAKITYTIDNLKSGTTSTGTKEITRHSQWNFGSFDKKGK